MLLIEHDMGLVLGICDRVVVLEFGQVIADGPPEVGPPRPARHRRLPRRGRDQRDAAAGTAHASMYRLAAQPPR